MAGAFCPLPAFLPLLKAHRFSHILERAGQEWLSAELAMGAAHTETERSGGDGAGAQLAVLARMGLPARGAGTAARGCQMYQLLKAWTWGRGGRGNRDSSLGLGQALSTIPPPSPIGLSLWLDRTFQEELKTAV